MITLFENSDDTAPQTYFVPWEVTSVSFVGGAGQTAGDGEDTVTFAPAIQNGVNGTLLTLTSVVQNDFSDDLEPINVMGDENMTVYAVRSVDPIPEPSSWILSGTGLLVGVPSYYGWRQRERSMWSQPAR
jgi:hypothetical protein